MVLRSGLQILLISLIGSVCIACGASGRNESPIVSQPSKIAPPIEQLDPAKDEKLLSSTSTPVLTTEPPTAAPSQVDTAEGNFNQGPAPNGVAPMSAWENPLTAIDRAHPFQQLDRFCIPYPPVQEETRDVRISVEPGDYLSRIADRYEVTVDELVRLNNLTDPNLLLVGQELLIAEEGPVGLGPQAMGRGISEDAVTITHLRTRLEELTNLGFDVDVGNEASMFKTFAEIVNKECGGLHGRQLDLRLVEVSAVGGAGVDIDTLRNAACIEATKTVPAVIVLSIGGLAGTAGRCLAVDNQTAYLSGDPQSSNVVNTADGRLLMDSFAAEQALEIMAVTAHQAGLLDNQSIAVILPDTPTQLQSVEIGLVRTLQRLGHEPAVYLLGCEGTVWCRTGLGNAVSKMTAQPPNVLFPTLNPVSLPELILAMETSGIVKPLIIQSDFNQHGTDEAAGLVLQYGGPQAALFYNGAVVIGHRDTGHHRLNGYTPPPFEEMCNDEYSRFSGHPRADAFQRDDAVYDTVVRACALLRYAVRALYDAGPNPTRRAIHEALTQLGNVDAPGMTGGSFKLGKASRPDAAWVLTYEYPCSHGPGYQFSKHEPGGCLIPRSRIQVAR